LAVALARNLRAIRIPWVLHLRCLELADPAVAAITEELAVTRSDNGVSPRINFSSGDPLTAYLSRNTRSALAKAHNRIKNAGLAIEMRWTREPEEMTAIVPEILRLYRKRSLQLGHDVPVLANADYRSYLADCASFVDVVHSYGEAGLARLLTLRLNGQLASYALCLESAGTMLVYSNRMSPDWARYSAGAITNAEVVRTAHSDRGIRCLDWGTGLQRYKLSGGATLHPHQNIHAWSSEMAREAWVWTQRARGWRLPQP
jgi:CelD/BcsL family acetyltransferase involved in cellulose biosynthesis